MYIIKTLEFCQSTTTCISWQQLSTPVEPIPKTLIWREAICESPDVCARVIQERTRDHQLNRLGKAIGSPVFIEAKKTL